MFVCPKPIRFQLESN